jgi:hypothetical protein
MWSNLDPCSAPSVRRETASGILEGPNVVNSKNSDGCGFSDVLVDCVALVAQVLGCSFILGRIARSQILKGSSRREHDGALDLDAL